MNIKNHLKKNIPQIGTWISIPSVVNVDIITSTGLDFIIIDFEHQCHQKQKQKENKDK